MFALDDALDGLALSHADDDDVAELGRSLMREAHHREPLKLAVALVGRMGDERDVPTLESLARHDEFSLVAGIALSHLLDDTVTAWWRVGCLATGWGKIEAVGRLAQEPELPADVRAWLLRHGCDNAVMPEYLAHPCATAGRLDEALGGLVDDELLDGACTIVRALVNGGPAEDINDYEPGPQVAAAVVELVGDRAPNLVRLDAVVDIRRWAEDYEEHVALAERCGRVLTRADVRAFVAERLAEADEALSVWTIAEAMGLDPWEAGWSHLQQADAGRRPVLRARADDERGALGASGRRSPSSTCRWSRSPRARATSCSRRRSSARRRARSPCSCRGSGPAAGRPRSSPRRC